VSLADRKWWMENTAPGQLARAMGRDPFAVDHDRADAEVEATAKFYERTYGRKLSETDTASVRLAAEQRSAPLVELRREFRTTAELVDAVNSANVTAAWRYIPVFRSGEGYAMRQPDGSWTGDQAIVSATEQAEEAKRVANEEAYEAWRRNPVTAGIAPPT
jgi:hypothetical protein